jgi:hypothetical protein
MTAGMRGQLVSMELFEFMITLQVPTLSYLFSFVWGTVWVYDCTESAYIIISVFISEVFEILELFLVNPVYLKTDANP